MKSVLITGGTVRIGLAIAGRLRSAGWRVITSSHRAGAGADIVADLSEPSGAARLFAAASALLGGGVPDALVNNAALFAGDAQKITAVNLEAPEKLTVMMAGREFGRGAVVNILDCRDDREGAYGESKRELRRWTLRAAAMFAGTISVNGVAPGPVLKPAGVSEKAGECPLGRPEADDVAQAVEFLLAARATTGCIIPVDGGQSILI